MIAVVGHVEWVEFVVVDRVPPPGEIAFAHGDAFFAPGGGGAVPAVELARLARAGGVAAAFFTSVGADALGETTERELRALGVEVHASRAAVPQRRAFTHLDARHERTITVVGERHVPLGAESLPWHALRDAGAVLFTGGDAEALRHARAARTLVGTVRSLAEHAETDVEVDFAIASAHDPAEMALLDRVRARRILLTEGADGGRYPGGRWKAAPLPGEPVDAYGCGDAFVAGLTYGLGTGRPLDEALAIGARSGARALTLRGPYGGAPS